MLQCPICGELLEALTNLHCQSRHQMSKREFLARHGTPKHLTPTIDRQVQQWIYKTQLIRRADFDLAQGSARNQRRR